MQLKDFIITWDNVLDDQSCDMLVRAFNERSTITEKHDTELYKFEQLNLMQSDMSGIGRQIATALVPYYEEYFERVGASEFIGIQGFEDLRIKKYVVGTGAQFKTHIDVADASSMKRYCIAILYLNDNDGVTEFPTLGVKTTPKKGSLIMFPPTWQYPHAGRLPSDNDKYILMTSLTYT